MTKLLLLTVVLMVPGIPLLTARFEDPRRGLKVTFALVAFTVAAYVLYLVTFWPKPEASF